MPFLKEYVPLKIKILDFFKKIQKHDFFPAKIHPENDGDGHQVHITRVMPILDKTRSLRFWREMGVPGFQKHQNHVILQGVVRVGRISEI